MPVVVPDCRELGGEGKFPTSWDCWLRSGELWDPETQQRWALVRCHTSSVLGGQKMQKVWASIRNSPSAAAAPCMYAGWTVNDAVMPRKFSRRFQKSHHRQHALLTNWSFVITRTFAYWKEPVVEGKENTLQVGEIVGASMAVVGDVHQ